MENLRDAEKNIKHTYIHIPFCKKICSYCDFCKVLYNEELVDRYLNSLKEEINSIYNGEYQETIYIGGGTPSSLNIKEINKLFDIIDKFYKDENTEITFECNFDSITKSKLDLLKQRGVNRISFGLETTNQEICKKINRTLDLNSVKKIIDYSKEIGLNNINIDLMYGFDNTNLENLKQDLDFLLGLDVVHISTYSLEIHENTSFYIKNEKRIDEELDREMYDYIHDYLEKNGYSHYEISNFSKKGHESKHNNCYWKNEHYYGFGVGASSYIKNKRITNSKSITSYLNNDIKKEIEELTKKDEMVYELILGLRLKEGIDIDDFYKRYNVSIYDIFETEKLINKKLITIENNRIKIPFNNWYTINSILVEFLEVNYE